MKVPSLPSFEKILLLFLLLSLVSTLYSLIINPLSCDYVHIFSTIQ